MLVKMTVQQWILATVLSASMGVSSTVLANYPNGTMVRDRPGGVVYEVRNGRKFPVVDTRKAQRGPVVDIQPSELAAIPDMPMQMQYSDVYNPASNPAYGAYPPYGTPSSTTIIVPPAPFTPAQTSNSPQFAGPRPPTSLPPPPLVGSPSAGNMPPPPPVGNR